MKVKVFDVIELKNEDKATVLEIIPDGYNVEVVDKNGISKERKTINEKDIVTVIYQSQIIK